MARATHGERTETCSIVASTAPNGGGKSALATSSTPATPRATETAPAVKLGRPSRIAYCFANVIDFPSSTSHLIVFSSTNEKVCLSFGPSLSVTMTTACFVSSSTR